MVVQFDFPIIQDCPFCGSSTSKVTDFCNSFSVCCDNCGCIGPRATVRDQRNKYGEDELACKMAAKAEAIRKWNSLEPRKVRKSVRELSPDEMEELKQRHAIQSGDADESEEYTDEQMYEEYDDCVFVEDDFFCNGGGDE